MIAHLITIACIILVQLFLTIRYIRSGKKIKNYRFKLWLGAMLAIALTHVLFTTVFDY
jgi:hypothetical protein